jgi:hypothetical protein
VSATPKPAAASSLTSKHPTISAETLAAAVAAAAREADEAGEGQDQGEGDGQEEYAEGDYHVEEYHGEGGDDGGEYHDEDGHHEGQEEEGADGHEAEYDEQAAYQEEAQDYDYGDHNDDHRQQGARDDEEEAQRQQPQQKQQQIKLDDERTALEREREERRRLELREQATLNASLPQVLSKAAVVTPNQLVKETFMEKVPTRARANAEICKFYNGPGGGCKFGENCNFIHQREVSRLVPVKMSAQAQALIAAQQQQQAAMRLPLETAPLPPELAPFAGRLADMVRAKEQSIMIQQMIDRNPTPQLIASLYRELRDYINPLIVGSYLFVQIQLCNDSID